MKLFFQKVINACANRFLERITRGWVVCSIAKTSTVLGFTVIDKKSIIGEYTYINRFCEITSATIGNYCSIGSGVRIGSGEHDLSLFSTSAIITGHAAEDLTIADCIIGHDVWIGTQAFVKRGVKVGNGAVIGANAVVTKDVPDFAIVVGNPAKIIKYRFKKEVRDDISSKEWWKLSPENARKVFKL